MLDFEAELKGKGLGLQQVDLPDSTYLASLAERSKGPVIFYHIIENELLTVANMFWIVTQSRAGIASLDRSMVWLNADSPEHAAVVWAEATVAFRRSAADQ